VKSHSQPWFTPGCAAVIAHHNHFLKKYHPDGSCQAQYLYCLASNCHKNVLENAILQCAESVLNDISAQKFGSRDFCRIAKKMLLKEIMCGQLSDENSSSNADSDELLGGKAALGKSMDISNRPSLANQRDAEQKYLCICF